MADLTSYYDNPELQAAAQNASGAQAGANAYQSAAALLPQKLRQAVNEKLEYNKDIIEQQNKAMSEYFSSGAEAREQYQDIFNPFQKEKLVAQKRSQAYLPYANLTDILGARMGSIENIIGAGTNAFDSAVLAEQGKAQLARQAYDDLLNLASLKSDAAYKQASLNKTGSGTAGERASAIAKAQLEKDIQAGKTLKDLVLTYGPELPLYKIIGAYDSQSYHGPHKESAEEIQNWLSGDNNEGGNKVDNYAQAVIEGSMELADVAKEDLELYGEVTKKIEEILTKDEEEAAKTEEPTYDWWNRITEFIGKNMTLPYQLPR